MRNRGGRPIASAGIFVVLVAGVAVPACGGSEPLPPAGPSVGAGGAVLAGRVVVTVLDEGTRALVGGAAVRARSIATGASLAEAVTGADGVAELSGTGLTGSISIEVDGPTSTQLVMGIRTDAVVIGLPGRAPSLTPVTGTVRGVPAGARVSVAAGTQVSLLRTTELSRAEAVPCAASGEGACSFELHTAVAESTAAATVTSEAGDVTGFVIGELGLAGGSLETAVSPVDLVASLPPATGLTAIVGVPGVARDGALVLLPQTSPSPGLFEVPALEGAIADASYWVIVEARPTMGPSGGDPNARTVLFARGAHTAAELPRWTAWLPTPDVSLDATGGVTFEAVPGADAHAVDWIDTRGEVLGSVWLIDDTVLFVEALVPSGITVADVARVRIRAIESSAPPRAGVFDAVALEEGIERFSERDVTP